MPVMVEAVMRVRATKSSLNFGSSTFSNPRCDDLISNYSFLPPRSTYVLFLW